MSRGPYEVTHIFFDVDGTLVDWDASHRAALEAAATYISGRLGKIVTPSVLQETRNRLYRQHGGRKSLNEVRRESFQQVFAERGVSDPRAAEEATLAYYTARDDTLAALPDVVEALTALRAAGFRLSTATNGNAALMRTPVFNLLHETFGAEEAGVSKPHPRFFEAALAKAGVEAACALMVGDRIDNDVEPALAAGMHAVLVDRDGTVDTSSDPGFEVIGSLAVLPERVRLPV